VLVAETQALALPALNAIECVTQQSRIAVAIAQHWTFAQSGAATTLTLFVIAGEVELNEAIRRARAAGARGFDANLQNHTAALHKEIEGSRIEIAPTSPPRRASVSGQMHLQMAFCYGNNRVGIPIKGLTGHGYRFVNFWDMDFHMFPYFLMTKPRSAHLLLEYRYNQLTRYRENAKLWGAAGAQSALGDPG